ncbi:cytochrome P450 [Kutzneria viridogrisea]|uniref:Cytochrome P450 n=1 Tax=Kutzneria viridogrisea TaxID=47990 RepID=A0ABR6BJD8_9PSEU|nr:hypothetical protein [Kutzneria viridogrisea]
MTDTIPTFPMTRAKGCPFDPSPELTELGEKGPVNRVRIWDGSTPWLITGYEEQRAALADPRISADVRKEGYPHVSESGKARRQHLQAFITMDNPEHDVHRRMLTRDFMVKRIEKLRPRVQEIVDGLIDQMLAGPRPADLVRDFALPVPSLVICELLGVPYADHDFFQRCSSRLLNRTVSAEEALAISDELRNYLIKLVAAKDAEPADDLLSRLVVEQLRTGALTDVEVADMAVLLLIAGHETTANMIALGTTALLQHPEQLAELRETEDPKLVANAVEELLRYLHIVHSGRRRVATEDIEIGGQLIRAGEGLIAAGEIGNREQGAFEGDPGELDIHRQSRHHVAFGYGIHQCLGQPLARMELQVVYSTLYRRIPTLRLAVPLEEIEFKHDMIVYGVHSLPVEW